MRKTVMYVLLCLVLVSGLFCVTANAAEELRFFFWGTQSRLAGFQSSIKAFEKKYPEIKVRIVPEMAGWTDYFQKMPVMFAAGEIADVSLVESSLYGQMIKPMANPPLLDLVPYMQRDKFDKDGFDTRNWPQLTKNGRVLGVPWATAIGAGETLGYNIRVFNEAGLALPNENWTWQDDFIPASRKLTVASADGQVERYASNLVGTFRPFWQQILYTYGGRMFNADKTELTLNEPRAYAALQLTRDLRANNLATWGTSVDLLPKGKIAMGYEWWAMQNVILGQMKDPYGVTVFPKGPAGHGIFVGPRTAPAHSLVISKNTRYPEAAWAFVKFITTEPEAMLAWAGLQERPQAPYRPLVKQWGELISPLEREHWLPAAVLWDKLAVPTEKVIDPDDTNTRQIDEILTAELTPFLDGNIAVEAAIAKAKQRIDAVLTQKK